MKWNFKYNTHNISIKIFYCKYPNTFMSYCMLLSGCKHSAHASRVRKVIKIPRRIRIRNFTSPAQQWTCSPLWKQPRTNTERLSIRFRKFFAFASLKILFNKLSLSVRHRRPSGGCFETYPFYLRSGTFFEVDRDIPRTGNTDLPLDAFRISRRARYLRRSSGNGSRYH